MDDPKSLAGVIDGINSWLSFALYLVGVAWTAAVGVVAFWAKRVIARHEAEKAREIERRLADPDEWGGTIVHKHEINGAPEHRRSPRGHDESERE